MKKVKDRHRAIKDLLSASESINVETLAEMLGVTGATVRKDIREMEEKHELFRSKGYVSLSRPRIIDLNINEKIFINSEQKKTIGKAAASIIGNDDSILITSGSTIDAFAKQIDAKGHLNVVTTSIGVALALSQNDNIDVMILGGRLVRNSLSVRDNYSIQGLENISCSKLFFSCDGLDLRSGVITAFVDEARMTAAMMKAAANVILLADSSKIGKTGLGKICELKDIDILVTDSGIPNSVRQEIERAGVHVIIADQPAAS